MKKRVLAVAFAFLMFCLLSSCDPAYWYEYSITNTTDTVITVSYKVFRFDSVLNVNRNETVVVFYGNHGVEGGKGGPYYEDVNKQFQYFIVSKQGDTSNRDYLKNETWGYGVVNGEGHYSATVDSSEF